MRRPRDDNDIGFTNDARLALAYVGRRSSKLCDGRTHLGYELITASEPDGDVADTKHGMLNGEERVTANEFGPRSPDVHGEITGNPNTVGREGWRKN